MKNILFLNTIQCEAWKNRALFLMLALVMSVANAWGHTDKHYGKMVLQNATGNGTVYLSTSSNQNAGDPSSKDPGKKNGTSWITWNCNYNESNDNKTYYARGTANDGYYYAGWAETASATTYKPATEGKSLKATSTDSSKPDSTIIYGFFKPNVKITETPAVEIYATFNPAEDSQADKTCVAVFNVENAESIDDFVDPPTIGGDDSDKFVYQSMSYTTNKVTINFVYNGNKEEGTHKATLTLKVIDKKGGTDKSINITAHNGPEAVNDVSVTTAAGVTTEYATWAEGLAAANANAGCTLQVLRNVTGGSLNATQKVTNTFTLDLNGKILSANYNGSIIYLNTAGKTLTIKDSKTGGRIENVNNAYAGMAIIVNAEKGNLIFESGTLYCENKGASGRRAVGIYNQAGTTVTMNGGKIEVHGYNNSQGVLQTSNKNDNTSFTMNNGEIEVDGYQDIYGVSAPGKVNINDGTINVTATYSNCRGITLSASASATAANCYWGTLTMKGGSINSTCTANADGTRSAYGVLFDCSNAAMSTAVATDGSHANKAASTGTIENATINVSTLGRYAYGVIAYGSYQSKTDHYNVIQIKNTKIDVTSQYYYTYGVYATGGVNSTHGAIYFANIELTDCDVTATTTKNHTAYAVWATTAANTIYKNAQPNYYGEYAGGATVTVNSGTYTANTGTTNAYAIGTSARAKTTYDSESNVTAERKLGGKAEGFATLNIHGGTFRANAGTTTSRAVSNGGNCTIDGGEFYATSGSTTADGIYIVSGKLKASGVKIEASATSTVYGIRVDAANVPYNTDAAWTGFNYAGDAELNNLDVTVTARTGATAYGVYLNAVSYQYTQSAFDTYMQGRIDAGKVTQANADIWAAVFPGNSSYAIAGKAVINGGTYRATAATTKAYAVHSAAKQIQGEKETAPSIVINSGKFWSEATSDYADISSACVPGYCVVKGGYYKNDAYITPVLDEGYNVFALQQNKEEHKTAYNEGYRWHVTNDFTGEIVCKVTHGSTTKIYDKLESAFNYVNDTMAANTAATIILCANYTLPAGKYTIPKDVTLLIPYDENHISSTTVKRINDANGTPTCYRYLTLTENVSISANGNIEVGGVQNNGGQLNVAVGAPRNHGKIRMHTNSSITLNGGSNLYCWGYIVGAEDDSEGTIIAKNGSTVHECLQIRDWKGGTASQNMVGNTNKAFPITQYYIQNIETPITYECGSTNKVSTGVIVSNYNLDVNDAVFIGSSSGLFRLLENPDTTKLKRDYIEETDRIEYTLEKGSATFNNINLKFEYNGDAGLGILIQQIVNKLNIKSEEYVMPFTNNMTMRIKENAQITISSDISLLPGVELYIEKNSTAITNGTTYLYDKDEWIGYENVEIYSIPYANEQNLKASPIRTWDKINDAKACINGLLEVGGSIYTTESGADICSTESGKIKFTKNAPSTDATVYQITGSGPDYTGKTAHPAWLHNDEEMNSTEPYTETSGAEAGDEFVYSQYYGKWLKNPKVITWDATTNGGTCETPQTVLPQQETKVPELPIATKTGYTFKGWFTDASGGDKITTETPVTEDVTYYAQFEFIEVGPQLDIVAADGTNLTINANGWASSGWPYTINDIPYEKNARQTDRTLVIPYSGQPNDDMPIEVKDEEGTVVSCHMYKVPFVYTGTEEMSDMNENSIVFVKSGTLTVGTASAKEIYVAPGAALQVNENGTLDVKKLVLRTTPFEAAILTNKGTIVGQVYYSRIARDTDFHLFAIPAGSNTAKVVLSDGTSAAVASTVAPYGNAWQLREYNTARRAEAGADGANWNNIGVNGDGKTYSDVAIEASKGYELRSGSKYYREYLFPVTLPTTATPVQVTAATGAAGAAHAGWNILCSPYTYIYTAVYNDPARGIKVSWQQPDGSYKQVQPDQIKPAVPFAYQASAKGTLAFDTNFTFVAAAPRKQSAAEALTETEWVHLDIFDAYGEGDETSLFVHPTRFEQTYKTGIDVAKQSLTAARPIIYSTHAYGDMAFAGVADSLLENGIDIAVYSPSAQELTFSLRENKFLHRLEYLWLADNETGERTDLLMDDYTCRANAGTIKGRFVLNGRFKAPQISTGIGNTQTDYNIYAIGNNIAISGVEQGTPIYVFDAVGHMIYTTTATSDEVIVPAPCAGVYMLTIGGQTAKLVINQ